MSKFLLPFCALNFLCFSPANATGLPTKLGTYQDPRSSKDPVNCGLMKRAERFSNADLVFFGKFLDRSEDKAKKVFLDEYRVIRAWKGTIKAGDKVKVEVPPSSDACTQHRSPLYEGEAVKTAGGMIVYARGTSPFVDCCMIESNDSALTDPDALERLNSDLSKIERTGK